MGTSEINLKMTADRRGVSEGKRDIPVGTVCEYVCHVSGGMVRVRLPGVDEDVVHQHMFRELRE